MKRFLWCMVLAVILGFSSCRSSRVATTSKVATRPMSAEKLIRNIENNAFDYKHLAIKRINCQFDNGRVSTSFKASIQAEKDELITLMISKLNIPLARVWLTPDSVKFISYLENTYFLDDYSYLSQKMGMKLDFDLVNAIISNNVFALQDENGDAEPEYESSVSNGMYVLQSAGGPLLADRKPARRMRKTEKAAAVRQTMHVDPSTYKIKKLILEDVQSIRKMNVEFAEYEQVGKQLYPGEIFLSLLSPDSDMQMKIKMGNFSLEKERSVRFKVPENFTRLNHE